MIDWEVVRDWTPIVISAIAIIISFVTLYVAHLRGPNIQLADPGGLYPLSYSSFGPNENEGSIDINLLFINVGVRSGILFNINLQTANIIYKVVYKPSLNKILPIIIPPGQGEHFKPILLTAKPSDKTWVETLRDHEFIQIELIFKSSTSFPWNRTKKKNLKIDIRNLKEYVDQSEL